MRIKGEGLFPLAEMQTRTGNDGTNLTFQYVSSIIYVWNLNYITALMDWLRIGGKNNIGYLILNMHVAV
jgi:hypothetical protein